MRRSGDNIDNTVRENRIDVSKQLQALAKSKDLKGTLAELNKTISLEEKEELAYAAYEKSKEHLKKAAYQIIASYGIFAAGVIASHKGYKEIGVASLLVIAPLFVNLGRHIYNGLEDWSIGIEVAKDLDRNSYEIV